MTTATRIPPTADEALKGARMAAVRAAARGKGPEFHARSVHIWTAAGKADYRGVQAALGDLVAYGLVKQVRPGWYVLTPSASGGKS